MGMQTTMEGLKIPQNVRLSVFWEFIFRHLENFHGFNFDSTRFKYRYFRSYDANEPTT